MIDGIESATTRLLVRALDAAELRHRTIVANIANASAGVPAVQPPGFEHEFEAVSRPAVFGSADLSGTNATPRRMPQESSASNASVDAAISPDGKPAQVRIDLEMARMGANSMHYQALLRGLDRHLSLMAIAVGDGKR